jgi:hypothetical protein
MKSQHAPKFTCCAALRPFDKIRWAVIEMLMDGPGSRSWLELGGTKSPFPSSENLRNEGLIESAGRQERRM